MSEKLGNFLYFLTKGGEIVRKIRWNYKKCVLNMLFIISVVFTSWFLISFVEIVVKNTGNNPVYCNCNFFRLILEYKELI